MAYPPGVTTATITCGSAIDFFAGPVKRLTVTVTPVLGGGAQSLTHTDTGVSMFVGSKTWSDEGTGLVSFALPHVDQPGWVNGQGETAKLWAYSARINAQLENGSSVQLAKSFQVFQGQEVVDLDLVETGQITTPVHAPMPAVTSVNGQTGAVTVVGGDTDLSAYATTEDLARVAAAKANLEDIVTAIDGIALADLTAEVLPDGTIKLTHKHASVNLSIYIPEGYTPSGPRTTVVGDSHSDASTIYGPGVMWWTRALQDAGCLAVPGRHGMEAWAGFTLNQMVYGSSAAGSSGTGENAPLTLALSKKPQTVVVMSGGNDAVHAGENPTTFRARFDVAHQRIVAAGAQMIYIFPPPLFATYGGTAEVKAEYLELRAAAREKCIEKAVPYFDIWADYPEAPAAWNFGDNTHYTAAAHNIIGGLIGGFLQKVIAPTILGSEPFGTNPTNDVYTGGTATLVTAPDGFTAAQAWQLTAPANGGYASVQVPATNVAAGERVEFAVRSKITAAGGAKGGLQLAIVDTADWSIKAAFKPMRWPEIDGRGGITWIADKAYPALRLMAVVNETDATVTAVVGDLKVTRTPAA